MSQRVYIAMDLKSFYASVECVERGLDPLTTNLVVADETRTEKTICLAVSPSLKKYGISGRARLFEVIETCKEIKERTGEEISYIIAEPRMRLYMEYSSKVYRTYLKHISPEDIHVYSIDEVFMDVTNYLGLYRDEAGNPYTARKLAEKLGKEVLQATGITATAGIGTNLYLAKIAMDILAKHEDVGPEGVRVAELDEKRYRQLLWDHKPLTDFWRIGKGIRKKLENYGMFTMGDVARMSLEPSGEEFLFRIFGVDAELLIDHAWGIEPCTMADIKNYKPDSNSLSSGQVLCSGYSYPKARMIIREMVELQALHLVEKQLMTNHVTLDIGYDRECIPTEYDGPMALDPYGRTLPKPAHGSSKLKRHTSSTEHLVEEALRVYDRVMDRRLCMKRVTLTFGNVIKNEKTQSETYEQLDLFTDYGKQQEQNERQKREKKLQKAMLQIQNRYGKNAILKGTNLEKGAKTISRNQQIGGHKA